MTPRAQPVADNGAQGDVVNTGEVPVLVNAPHVFHHVLFDATLANEPEGAACIRIAGPPTLSAAQAIRLGEELIQMATHVAEVRSLRGMDQ